MEVGRRRLSSENEFRERSSRKKMGAPPLAMILSFNDRDVHPDCPNVSNPYHKCGRHCIDKIPSGKNFLDAIRSDGNWDWEKESYKKVVNLNCPYASNPYHKCAEYCSEKLSEKRQDALKDRPGINPKEEKREVFTTERGVKAECIYASNPYHVCAEYCFQTVPGKDQPGQSMRLKGSKAGEKVLSTKEKTGFHPQCKHASNPNHECTESCFLSVTDRNVAEGEKPKGVSNKTNKSSVHLNRNASGHNKVTEYSFEDTPKKENLKRDMKPKKENEIDVTTQRGFSFECKNTSNPYHVCVEHCFQSVPEKEQHGKAEKSKEESEIIATAEQRVNLEYNNASSPSHECPEYRSESMVERDRHEQENPEGICMEADKHVHSSPKHASCPYNKVTEHYFEDTSEKEQPEGAINPKEESEIAFMTEQGFQPEGEKPDGGSFKIDKSGALRMHKHVSNPYNEVIEDNPEKEYPNGAMKLKEERIVVTAKRGANLVCKYSSNPYHECTEYCFQNLSMKDQLGKALIKSKENKEVAVPLERVNPQCKHASNPYHVCAEYCFQNVSNGHHPERPMVKSKEEKKVVSSPQVVTFDCKYASNPYHVCAEYCFENVLEKDQPNHTIKKLKEEVIVVPSERGANPECKFASNPYHVCAEYCFQNALRREQNGPVMKLKSAKELKNLVSKKKITSEHTQCEYASNPYHQCAEYCFNKNIPGSKIPDGVVKTNERKKEKGYAPRKYDNPKYKNASNSFHGCGEYSPEEISPKIAAVEGSTATVKEKKKISSKENKRNHPNVEKISLNYKYMEEASKPSHNYTESSEGIILQDATVEAFEPTNYNFNVNNGISMDKQDETKELQSAKVLDMKNPKEPTDVPPLHIDASDILHEWAKYCSQTKVAEDEIVKVGMGEFSTRNGAEGNGILKDYDSANYMEKVQATRGFPRSLPISLLFLLGFLLALLKWTQVIHSLVMSSEKNEELKKMKHERHLNPKCRKAYDPYHKCSRCCFPVVGEESH